MGWILSISGKIRLKCRLYFRIAVRRAGHIVHNDKYILHNA